VSMNVANCPRCGRIFVKGIQEVCPNCTKEIDLQLDKCIKFLRENRGSTLDEVSEANDVPVRQIMKFIRQGRISIIRYPNMGYPCEVCATHIREGSICESCRSKMVEDMANSQEDEARRQEKIRQQSKVGYNIHDRLNERH
jgi:flagellar operon protein (TIGR03826 family)